MDNLESKSFGRIYCSTNNINNKSYIGQTYLTLEERKWEHEHTCKSQRFMFQHALHKYGFDNFKWEILCECSSIDEMNEKEQYYIKHFNTHYIDGYGYNMTYGGLGSNGYKHTDKTKQKISESNLGKKLTDETKRKISEAKLNMSDETKRKMSKSLMGHKVSNKTRQKLSDVNKGKKLSDETKNKISEKSKGSNNGMYGKHHSEEAKRKISEVHKGKIPWDRNIKRPDISNGQIGENNPNVGIYEITLPDGSIDIIKCLKIVCEKYNFNYNSLGRAIKYGKLYKGYKIKKLN